MRITQQQTQENRERIVHVAARLYREHGFDGIGIADVMKSAGFTHGGFYNHFASKEALAAEATKLAFQEIAETRARSGDLATFLAAYLSATNRTRPGQICPAATLGGDAARSSDDVKAVFADGVQGMISFIEDRLRKECHLSKEEAHNRAVNLTAKLTGALMLARAVPDDHPLAREILKSCLDGCLAEIRGQSSLPQT
jgi:TetR/AcrR family transcriptional repressor of nem operon